MRGSRNKGIKSNIVTFYFSSMDNEIVREEEERRNVLVAVLPPPFCVKNVVITQPSESEIYTKHTEPWERSLQFGYD